MNISPMNVLKEAINAVPSVKYALGIAGVVSVIAIIVGFNIDLKVALFGTVIMIALMYLLLVFSYTASSKNKKSLRIPSLFLAWSVLIIMIFSSTLLATSFFFAWPRDIYYYFPKNEEGNKFLMSGYVFDTNKNPIGDVLITIDSYDFHARTNENGYFMADLKGAKIGEIITLRAYHDGFNTRSDIRKISKAEENFDIIMTER